MLVDENNNYSIDFEDFEAKCADPKNKLFIFCNPHNPAGQIWSREDVQRLIDISKKHNVVMFSDEVLSDLIRKGETFTSALNVENSKDVIVATAANKTFNLAGLHISNLIIKDAFTRSRLNVQMNTSITAFNEAAAIAAYSQGEEWLEELRNVLDENIKYMDEFIKTHLPKIKFNAPQGTYLTWLDFRAYDIKEDNLLYLLSEKARLILEGGSMFGKESEGFIRMNIACTKETLIEALSRIKKLMNSDFKSHLKSNPKVEYTLIHQGGSCGCSSCRH